MFLKAAASIILCTSLFMGSLPIGSYPFMDRKGAFRPASFEGYELTLADGETVSMMLSGKNIVFESSMDRKFNVCLSQVKDLRTVRNFPASGESFNIEVASSMKEDKLYYVDISYEAYGLTLTLSDNIIFKTGDNLYFYKNVNYDYNVQTTSEMWTDEQSLEECLEPQNDIECDDPVVIEYSNRICAGAKDDWEKVFNIYMYVAGQMAYDEGEAGDETSGYQDGAVAVMRDGKGICEGFSNVFVALCRAQGIPAVVEFGIGFADYEELTERNPQPEDWSDHAWAAVYLGGKWHFVDPTYDMARFVDADGNVETYDYSTLFYLLPLEAFSNDHRIMDADTRHGIESAGYCGDNATYEITRDGVCYIKGEGTLQMPVGLTGFNKLVFDPDCKITTIGKDCFADCDLITVVRLPDSVTVIDDAAFDSCEDLEYVYLPDGLERIGMKAFCFCDELSYVYIPDSVNEMGIWAFDECPRLYISMPSDMTRFIDDYDQTPMHVEER